MGTLGDAADADNRHLAERRTDVVDGTHGHGPDCGARQPAAADAERGLCGDGVDRHAEDRVDERESLSPGFERCGGNLDEIGHVRGELRPHRYARGG